MLELVRARDEVRFAVDFDQHAELRAGVDVAGNEPLLGGARGLFGRRSDAAFAKHHFRFRQLALGLEQCTLAFHHARAGALAELFH